MKTECDRILKLEGELKEFELNGAESDSELEKVVMFSLLYKEEEARIEKEH